MSGGLGLGISSVLHGRVETRTRNSVRALRVSPAPGAFTAQSCTQAITSNRLMQVRNPSESNNKNPSSFDPFFQRQVSSGSDRQQCKLRHFLNHVCASDLLHASARPEGLSIGAWRLRSIADADAATWCGTTLPRSIGPATVVPIVNRRATMKITASHQAPIAHYITERERLAKREREADGGTVCNQAPEPDPGLGQFRLGS